MSFRIEIVLDDNGSISVTGPIQNEILTFGLLEKAKDVIRDSNREAATNRIMKPTLKISGRG